MKTRFWQDQQGSALVEMMVALMMITSLMMVGFKAWQTRQHQQQNQMMAEQTKIVMKATEGYILTHYQELARQAQVRPATITIDQLKQGGWLSPVFTNRNVYQQQYGVLVRKLAAQELEVLVLTHQGEAMNAITGHDVAASLGAAGGYIDETGTIQGAFGGWQLAVQNYQGASLTPAPGHLGVLLFFNQGNLLTNYLHRYPVDGYPEANRMFNALDMNQHNIDHVAKINVVTLEAGAQRLNEAQFRTLNELHPMRCGPYEALSRDLSGQFYCVPTVPPGVIAAFNLHQCPAGWQPFQGAAGRFLVGVGQLGSDFYSLGQTGGEAHVTLSEAQMPKHHHSYPMGTGEKTYSTNLPANAENDGGPVGKTAEAGGGQPHENRPPYLGVLYCLKQ